MRLYQLFDTTISVALNMPEWDDSETIEAKNDEWRKYDILETVFQLFQDHNLLSLRHIAAHAERLAKIEEDLLIHENSDTNDNA